MSKEIEAFEAWAEREMPLTYKRAILNDVSCAQETRELNFARKGYKAATAHYQTLLDAKDAEIGSLKTLLEIRAMGVEELLKKLYEQNTVLKALLEQAREGFENIVMHISEMKKGAVTNQDGWFLRLSKQTLAAINAATGKGE